MNRVEGDKELVAELNVALAAVSKPKPPQSREQKLEQALQGIASCATQCPCCEMHRRVAVRALGYEVTITTDSID